MMGHQAESPDLPIVTFVGVGKSYDGETLVVKNLDLEVRCGEFMTLLGPSGSGKTTTLLMVAGFESPTRGDILLDGRSIKGLPPHKRGLGMVFQNYALFPHMTVAENLAFPLKARKFPRATIANKVRQMLQLVQLADCGNRRPSQLSGGQQQRIAFARALIFEPRLVLMDEPLGALDRQLREAMQYEIKQIHESLGVTVIYVTHDQSEALTMSDRIAVFDSGQIRQVAAPADLYERPNNAFVARFIGENNRLRGRVRAIEGEHCLVEVEGGTVRALAINVGEVGAETMVSLRPERVGLNPPKGAYANLFKGMVGNIVYLGDHIRVRISICGRDDFVAKIQNVGNHLGIQIGQKIEVGWRVEDCRALDAG